MKNVILAVLLGIMVGCGIDRPQEKGVYTPPNLDRRDAIRFKQYLVNGKKTYLAQCSNCHQTDGSGLQKLYPPLAKADFLSKNLSKSICIVQNGYDDPLIVNGVEYNMVMPAFQQLTPIEIAEVMTYIGNKWGNELGFIQV